MARWTPRAIPLVLKVPLLVALLMIGVAGIVSKLVLLRLEATQAAERLGVSRSTLFDKVRRLNVRAVTLAPIKSEFPD